MLNFPVKCRVNVCLNLLPFWRQSSVNPGYQRPTEANTKLCLVIMNMIKGKTLWQFEKGICTQEQTKEERKLESGAMFTVGKAEESECRMQRWVCQSCWPLLEQEAEVLKKARAAASRGGCPWPVLQHSFSAVFTLVLHTSFQVKVWLNSSF